APPATGARGSRPHIKYVRHRGGGTPPPPTKPAVREKRPPFPFSPPHHAENPRKRAGLKYLPPLSACPCRGRTIAARALAPAEVGSTRFQPLQCRTRASPSSGAGRGLKTRPTISCG